jgi:hypothetical protein
MLFNRSMAVFSHVIREGVFSVTLVVAGFLEED